MIIVDEVSPHHCQTIYVIKP